MDAMPVKKKLASLLAGSLCVMAFASACSAAVNAEASYLSCPLTIGFLVVPSAALLRPQG